MNRIQCTRCVRFSAEVAGAPRWARPAAQHSASTTHPEHALTSKLEGNLVDICPVGALTSKPYAFAARPGESARPKSVDVMDGVCSAIRVDTRGREVMRILPRLNEAVRKEWISDRKGNGGPAQGSGWNWPYIREGGKLRAASWKREAFSAIAANAPASGERTSAIAGDLSGIEEMFALKGTACRMRLGQPRSAGRRCLRHQGRPALLNNIFNQFTIAGIDKADALIIGSNPRKEAAVLNARIRKR